MRKFARLGLSFALLIIAMSTQSNEKITTGEPVTTLSNGDFSAMLERLDSIYLSGSLQTYISEAIALSNEPGITLYQQEQVAENLLWDCAYVSDLDCVRMVLEWRIQVFRYPDDLDQLVEADFEERKKVYSIWLRLSTQRMNKV